MLIRNARHPGPNHGAIVQPAKPLPPGEQLLDEMRIYARDHRTSLAQICTGAGVDNSLIWRLRNGFNPRKDIESRVRAFMRENVK